MKTIIREIDPSAFVTVYEVIEVKGGTSKNGMYINPSKKQARTYPSVHACFYLNNVIK